MNRHYISILYLLLLSMAFVHVQAAPIHKWVDDKGVTHYSDQAPTQKTAKVKKLIVFDKYRDSNNENNYYSIANQWSRMYEERIERKRIQLEKAKQIFAQRPSEPQIIYINSQQEHSGHTYYPVYHHTLGYPANRIHTHQSRRGGKSIRGSGKSLIGRNGKNYRLPSISNSRYRGAGLTLTIR